MALTRRYLKDMGIDDEKIDSIILAHSETVDGLKSERDKYKADADKLPLVEAKVTDLEKNKGDDWKVKHDALQGEFDAYKGNITKQERIAKAKAAFNSLLVDLKIDNKRHAAIEKVTDFATIQIDENGLIKDADKLKTSLATEWADFIVTTQTGGRTVATPINQDPPPDYDKMSDEDYYKSIQPKK